jgi:tyrosinase
VIIHSYKYRNMKKSSTPKPALMLAIFVLVFSSCAVIPRCPNQLLPILETQINYSPGSEDDYLTTTGFIPCHVKISNAAKFGGGFNFPGGVQVEIRNVSAGSLLYSTTGTDAGSASIFVTLPQNGDFLHFFTKGTTGSTVDKTSIIEVATAGASCNEVVLTRQATMVPSGALPITVTGTSKVVQLEVASVSHLDDYVAWAPTFCRIKWTNPPSAAATLTVRLQNMPGTNRLAFADNTLAGGNTAKNATVNLTLSGDGSWVNFYLAGNYPNSSLTDKDAVIEVIDQGTSTLMAREAVMVRIRKNANTLSVPERDRYLKAIKKMDLTYDDYITFVRTHARDNTGIGGSGLGYRQAHRGSGFLPWHRAFVLQLERILQAADPSVALHYWKFDDNAPNMFTQDFMGANNTTVSDMAILSAGNPIVSWSLPGESVPTGIQRKTPYGDGGHPLTATETATLALGGPGFTYALFRAMENNAHDPAHFRSGANSWIGPDPALAVRDPLFFFLHCNVDRLWAKWQWMRARHSITDVSAYDLQGSHATPAAGVAAPAWTISPMGEVLANRTLGQYAEDSMWPWDNVTSSYSTVAQTNATLASTAGRPNIALLTPFPMVLGGILPGSKPQVRNTIDYIGITSTPSPGLALGFGYDDFFPFP